MSASIPEPGRVSPMYDPVSVETPADGQHSALSTLREPLFRTLWIAALVSYTGSWMQNIATGWLMTSLTRSPMWVSLVQVALSLPVFLIALPAGALADMVDRRKFLLVTQASMVAAAAVLGVLTVTGRVNPQLLLTFTFLLGAGAVMNDPAWQSLMPDLVPREKLSSAVALNSAGFNIARAVGPALGGLVIAMAGSGTVFLLNAISFFGVILFLYHWKPAPRDNGGPGITFKAAISVGLSYARSEKRIRSVLVRTFVFAVFASAFWALLPLIASKFGARGYGAMLAFFGVGALAGALALSLAHRNLSRDAIVASATLLFAVAMFALGLNETLTVASIAAAAAGMAYISLLATLNMVAQTACTAWVRARVMSMYVLVLQGGLALGSLLWGLVASAIGVHLTLTWAAGALVAGLIIAPWYRLAAAAENGPGKKLANSTSHSE
ncbi:MAG TPA: MFS transporter [Candidatus Angelobacter sp.]|nr:MFS transporter [Candidatus Angelobacter sp.]